MTTAFTLPVTDSKKLLIIRAGVLLLHLAFFFFVVQVGNLKPETKPTTKILVRTVTLDSANKGSKSKASSAQISSPPKTQKPPQKAMEEVAEPAMQPLVVEKPVAAQKVVAEQPAPEKVEPKKVEPKKEVAAKPIPKEAVKPKPAPKQVAKQKVEPKQVTKPVQKKAAAVKPTPKKVESKPNTPAKEAEIKRQNEINKQKESKKRAEAEAKAKADAKKKAEAQAAAKQEALIADAMSSLNRSGSLDEKRAKVASSAGAMVSPSQIKNLASDSLVSVQNEGETLTGHERTYYDELVHRLKLQLKLPDYGDIKLNLTLNRAGKVVQVVCVKSKSAKNRAHVEKMLPKIVFPGFGQNFPKEEQHTFRLHLTNELSY